MTSGKTVALVGTPNVGKSTLFNALTGLRQRVGNFPGVTVEPMVGTVVTPEGSINLIDLPGVYSLDPASEDERLTIETLQGKHHSIPRPDAVLLVISSVDLEKCLALYAALSSLNIPVLCCLTMVDALKAGGGMIDDIGMGHELGVTIIPVVGSKGLGIQDVKHALAQPLRIPRAPDIGDSVESRLKWAQGLVSRFVKPAAERALTRWLDKILLHPVWGTLVFISVMYFFFQSIFAWAEPLMELVENSFGWLQTWVGTMDMHPLLASFLSNGIIGGVGSLLVFLPQILILNLLITILEESGYLARGAFLVDRAMGVFGLQGRSFIPLLGSFACAIPGIMAARVIPSYRDRIATIMAAPLMTCSARLPVYVLIIAAVIPNTTIAGVFSLQGTVLAGLYVLGAISGLLIALVLKRTALRGSVVPFMIEFPEYRLPSLKNIGTVLFSRARDFVVATFTVIMGFSVVLWIFTQLPQATIPEGTSEVQAQHIQLEQSYAADIGKAIQPFFEPLGFDWRITIGVLTSYGARETFVSTMGQMYAADVADTDSSLRSILPEKFSLATGLSLLVYYVYALQCISTIIVMRRETATWKWPALAFAITFVLAYALSALTYALAG